MKDKLKSHLQDLNWKLRLVENQIMTAQKLEHKVEVIYLREIAEVYKWEIFRIEQILEENGNK